MAKIIGRTEEIVSMNRLYDSGKAELVAVYGRRRIGKTFLVDESLKGKITFRHAGLSPVDELGKHNFLKDQLKHFYYSLQLHGMKKSKCPSSWQEAFFLLETHLQNTDNGGRQVVFLDELPWLDTPRSGFLTAFEGFWNTWGCWADALHPHGFDASLKRTAEPHLVFILRRDGRIGRDTGKYRTSRRSPNRTAFRRRYTYTEDLP